MHLVESKNPRTESRRTRLRTCLYDLSVLRLCGPSDDPDEQTGVIEGYRYLLINIKRLSKGIVSSELQEELDSVPSNINHIYDVYESKAHLDAVAGDIEADLDNLPAPSDSTPQYGLLPSSLIERLNQVHSNTFDVTKLKGYCKEINSTFYHGNFVACLLLMRTVLNHVPPIFGHDTFSQVLSQCGRSVRDNFEHLDNGLRKLADLYAHQPIRSKEQYPTRGQVEPFRPQFELLIQEVLNRL